MPYIGPTPIPQASQVLQEGTFNNPTRFIEVAGGYQPGNITVYVNGVRLLEEDYVASDGNQVDLVDTFPTGTVYAIEEVRAFNVADTYTKAEANSRFSTAGASGGGNDEIFYENGQVVNFDYTILANKNALSAGPITIADTATVTIEDGAIWHIL